MSELEKMLAGQLYDPMDEELVELKNKCHRLCREFNTLDDNDPRRDEILDELGIKRGKGAFLQGPIYFDYGCFIEIGDYSYANFNLTILDSCLVKIGNNVFMGTGVTLVTPVHPFHYEDRNIYFDKEKGYFTDREAAKPITIEDNCWICSNVTVAGGVTIGEGSVIGAGSVVVRSIPKNSFAAGNPCRVIRKITEKDKIEFKK